LEIIIALVFSYKAHYQFVESSQRIIDTKSSLIREVADSEIKFMESMYSSRITGMLKANRHILEKFVTGQRKALAKDIYKRLETLRKENKFFWNIFFIDKDNRSFFRTSRPEKYGDYVGGLDFVKDAVKSEKPLAGIVYTKKGVYFRVVDKIYYNGEYQGLAGFSISLEVISEKIKKFFDIDYGILIKPEKATSIKTGKYLNGYVIYSDKSRKLLEELPEDIDLDNPSEIVDIYDRHFSLISVPVKDYKSRVVGYFVTLLDFTDLKHQSEELIRGIVFLSLFMIIVSIFVLYFSFGVLIGKLHQLNMNLEKRVEERTGELNAANKELEKAFLQQENIAADLLAAKEEALKKNKTISSLYERFRNMFLDHHAIMILFDPENADIVDVNFAAANYFGYTREVFKSKNIRDISTMDEFQLKETMSRISTSGISGAVVTDRLADGTERQMEMHASAVKFEERTLLFAILHDVTDKVKYENELNKLNQMLEHRVDEETSKRRRNELLLMQQTKMIAAGEMLSAIIHQWKQPLTALKIMIDDIEDAKSYGELNDEYLVESLAKCNSQLKYMDNTISDFRSFLLPSREKEVFNIYQMVSDVLMIVAPQLIMNNIEIKLKLYQEIVKIDDILSGSFTVPEENEKINSLGYPNELKQVLINIIHNSRDAIINSENKNCGKIFINIENEAGRNLISVTDNGGGVPKKIAGHIFEPYFTTKDKEGTGIGLYMAQIIIEEHMGGKLDFENVDYGASFIINLPSVN